MPLHHWSSRRRALAVAVSLVFALGAAGCGSDDESPARGSGAEQKFVVAAGGVGVYNATPYIAESNGYFADAGLDVTINQAGSNTLNLVVGGQADVGMAGATTALFPIQNGKKTALIYANDTTGSYAFAAARDPKVTSLKQCKKMASGASGTSTYAMAALLKQKSGAGFTIMPFTTPDTMMATVLSGRSDCVSSNLSIIKPSIDKGELHLIVDPAKPETLPAGIPSNGPGIGVWGLADHLDERRDAVVAFVGALSKATEFMRDHSDEEVARLLRKDQDFQSIPVEDLAAQVAIERQFLPNATDVIPESAWAAYLDFAKVSIPGVDDSAQWSHGAVVDLSYLAGS